MAKISMPAKGNKKIEEEIKFIYPAFETFLQTKNVPKLVEGDQYS